MGYIIVFAFVLLILVLFNRFHNDKIKELSHRTCEGCGYIYPKNFDFKKANWMTSAHKHPKTKKDCYWFYHQGCQTYDD
jgi:hypothetical protein